MDEEERIAEVTKSMKQADKQKFLEWYANAKDESSKAIVLAMLRRRTTKGRLETLATYLVYWPVAGLLTLGPTSVIIFLISFLSAFICWKQ